MRKILIVIILISYKAEAQSSALAVADSLYALGNYSKAISVYQKTPKNSLKIAKCYEALGNLTKAVDFYKAALQENSKSTIIQYNYAKLLMRARKFESADTLIRKLIQQQPSNPNFVYQYGLLLEKVNDTTSNKQFARAVALDANHQEATYKLARYLTTKRQFAKAKPLLEKALTTNPESFRFLTLQALNYFYTEYYHDAITIYEKLQTLGPTNEQMLENLALCYRGTNRFPDAIETYTILINTIDDKRSKWHLGLGQSYLALREYEKAKRHIEISMALKDLPLEPEYWSLYQMYSRQKKYKEQIDVLKLIIKENPRNERAHYFLAAATDNFFKNKEEAIPYYEKYLKTFGEKAVFANYAKQRISDIKTKAHFEKDK